MMHRSNPREYFRLFFETAQAILSAQNLKATLNSLVENIACAMNVKAASLRLIDEQSNILELVASYGLSETYLHKGTVNANLSLPEAMTGQAIYIKDAFDDPRIQYPKALIEERINTILSVPVIVREKVIGLMRLYSKDSRDYTDEDIEFVSALAEMGGLAIINAQHIQDEGDKLKSLFTEIGVDDVSKTENEPIEFQSCAFLPIDSDHNLSYFRTLHEISRAILSTLDSNKVMQLIVDKIISCMQIKACALRLRNETSQKLELIVASGLSETFLSKGGVHTDLSISETLLGKPVLIHDTHTDSRLEYPAETVAEGIASILSMPIIARQKVIGVLRLYSAEKRHYSQEDISFLSAVAEISGIAIMNAKLFETTRNDLSFWTTTMDYMNE